MPIHLLSLGNNYPGTSSELYGCANDARDTAKTFKPWCKTQTVLVDGKADWDGVRKAARKVAERLEPGDLWLISTSGHGTREKRGGQYHEGVVFADFHVVWDYQWAGLLADRPAKTHVAVFADHCFSLGFARGNPQRIKSIPVSRCSRDRYAPPPKQRALANVIYFSAAAENEYAYDATFDGRANGALTYHLLKAFRERGERDTFNRLYWRIREALPCEDYDQTPGVVASAANLRRTLRSFV